MRMLGMEKAYAQSNAYKKLSCARKTLLQGPLLDLKLSDLRVFAIIQNAEERTLYAAEKKGMCSLVGKWNPKARIQIFTSRKKNARWLSARSD